MRDINKNRARRAQYSLDAYIDICPTDDCNVLCDLLTDLMHYADMANDNFEKELDRAQMHYNAELIEE
jgi:hypothetical protein